jgi:hypothetical protein
MNDRRTKEQCEKHSQEMIELIERHKAEFITQKIAENEPPEYEYLKLCQFDRDLCYYKHLEFITAMCDNKKGKIYRAQLKAWLGYNASHVYPNEELQYEAINKFGRGIWSERRIKNTFTAAEQLVIIEIAKGYGAFNY